MYRSAICWLPDAGTLKEMKSISNASCLPAIIADAVFIFWILVPLRQAG